MRRLYLQIWFAFLGILLIFALLVASFWWLLPDERQGHHLLEGMAQLVGEALPGKDAPAREVQTSLDRLAARFAAVVTVRDPAGAVIAHAGPPLPPPPPGLDTSGFVHLPGGPVTVLRLADGRTVMVRPARHSRGIGLFAALGLLLITSAGGAFFVVRRITGRLERLQSRVDALGAGDLSARVQVEGRDEVAELATSFNRAAGRIERLVGTQKSLLANVSHELRSPLARMRMAVELLGGDERPELRERLARDIGELDALIGELLEASRLDAGATDERTEDVDVLALVAEEAADTGAEVSGGEGTTIRGDRRLLRRLVRNLLENARRHGGGTAVEVTVVAERATVIVRVSDRGPGVPATERERIFEPFYRVRGTAETGSGVGLGLALVREIARRHGGDAHCEDRPDGGSVFVVALRRLPVARAS
ncbi:MAG: HAMP domain-containing sensor histidine kinase [Betaproteobacteria bacterium]